MQILITILVTFFAGMGAGLGTGFAGMSAAAVISPMLITFLGMDPVRCIYPDLGADRCTVRQQGNPQDPEPCHRCDPGGAGHCSYVF